MIPTTTTQVRLVTPEDRSAVSRALSGAFFDDPVFRWVYPDADRRAAALPGFFDLLGAAIGRHGVSLAAGDGLGAALWVPPGERVVEEGRGEAFGAALAALSPEDAGRLAVCNEVLEASHPSAPCWYLNLLGVRPEHQGEGIGSALLRVALARCDEAGEPAYLEATSPDNRRLYERHGFRVVQELRLPDGPSLWAMWRQPAAEDSPLFVALTADERPEGDEDVRGAVLRRLDGSADHESDKERAVRPARHPCG